MHKYKNRSEVEEQYKWDLSDFFKDEDDFLEKFKICDKKIDKLKDYVGCSKDPDILYEFLEKRTEVISLFENLYVYSYLINDQELGNSDSIERLNKTRVLNSKLEQNISFFEPEILKLSIDQYNSLFKSCKKLDEYKFLLDKIYRESSHILTDHEEKIVSELVNSMNCYSQVSSTLLNRENDYGTVNVLGEVIDIATNNYGKLLKNKDKEVRKHVFKSFNKVLDQYGSTSSNLLNAYVGMNNSLALIRNYSSSFDAKLFNLNLSKNVFSVLYSTVNDNLDALHRYYKLKKDMLNISDFHSYDLNLKMSHCDKEYSISDAQAIVRDALSVLGNDYISKFDNVINKRYIDYCQYKGKCSGGYSFGTSSLNSRILINFNNDLISVSTIAHEVGHNINNQYILSNNPLQYRDTSPITAEVASLVNECLLSHYLINNAKTKEEKLLGIENILDVMVSNLFGAVREGKIEEDMYNYVLNGSSITKDYMDKLSFDSLKRYYGDEVICDDECKNNWIRRSHYYMNFYLYSYSICISVAVNIFRKIIDNESSFVSKYIEFLKTGSDVWPIDIYKNLGIDLEDSSVYINAIEYFNDLIDEYYQISSEGK